MCYCQHCTIFEGIGYVFLNQCYYGPTLLPVNDQEYALTREDAIELWRSTIESDLTYLQEKADKLPGLKLLLASNSSKWTGIGALLATS